MAEADQTATTDAREASQAQNTDSTAAATEQTTQVDGVEGEGKPKAKASERWQKLANERRDAREAADRANAENAELRRRLDALEARTSLPETDPEPKREDFATEGDYLKAAAKHLAKQEIIAERTREEQERARAYQAELETAFNARRDKAMAEIDDFAETLTNSSVSIPDSLMPALLESEHGPFLAYFLAKNPDEARRLGQMSHSAAIRYLVKLERELDDTPSEPKQRPRAPDPINPVRGAPVTSPGKPRSFQEYKAARLAEQAKKQ